ncbi:MAG: hypothetical protein MUD04_10460 [Cyanobium sp. Prado107]|jgi:hypothetical protein|nr:hypothetical protein [Cyanobium sp. Prado107]
MTSRRPLAPSRRLVLTLACSLSLASAGAARAETCTFLRPIGGDSQNPVVTKRVERPRVAPLGMLLGRTNWNTDFAVERDFTSYRINFQSASTERGVFPVAAFLRFTDNTNIRLVDENVTLQPEESRSFGPFPAVPGRRTNQVNVRVGSTTMPGSIGFSYRVSVEGCT